MGLGQHFCPQQFWYWHNKHACAATPLSLKGRRINPWLVGGLCYHGAAAREKKVLSCTGELSCGSHSCWDTVPPGGCILMGSVWWCREAVLPAGFVKLTASCGPGGTSLGLSAKRSQSLAGRRVRYSLASPHCEERSVFRCGTHREISCGLSWASSIISVKTLMEVIFGVKGKNGVGTKMC